jgi:hypothetical protein
MLDRPLIVRMLDTETETRVTPFQKRTHLCALSKSVHSLCVHILIKAKRKASLPWTLDDDHHFDGIRPHLWTVATNEPTVHSPRDGPVLTRRAMMKWYRQGKTPDSFTRPIWQSYQPSNLVAKQEELAKKIIIFALRNISFILRRVL